MASSASRPTTSGELLFQDYLDAMHYPYEFEKNFPDKKKPPDYTVNRDGVFLFDVKDFEPNNVSLGCGAYDPYPRIREKIDQGRKKFKEFKEYPCSLVLWNNGDGFVHLERPEIVLGAMYGDSGLTVPINTSTGTASGDFSPTFLGRGKMFRYGDVANAKNTTISALITLRHVGIGIGRINRIWDERKKVDKNFGKEDLWAAISEVCAAAAERYADFDAEEKRLGVIVWENAVARIPLSRELFTGPYDERWGHEGGHQFIVFRGEKLAEVAEPSDNADV
jgi:hypothetical protein